MFEDWSTIVAWKQVSIEYLLPAMRFNNALLPIEPFWIAAEHVQPCELIHRSSASSQARAVSENIRRLLRRQVTPRIVNLKMMMRNFGLQSSRGNLNPLISWNKTSGISIGYNIASQTLKGQFGRKDGWHSGNCTKASDKIDG
jgi:hypothetical protein